MKLKFKAYDPAIGGWYKPEEVFICNDNIYLDDEDFDELIQNNNVLLFQSTGWTDENDTEIFSDDIVSQYDAEGNLLIKGKVKFVNGCWIISDENKNERKLFDYGVNTRLESEKR
mgnify:FL=1